MNVGISHGSLNEAANDLCLSFDSLFKWLGRFT